MSELKTHSLISDSTAFALVTTISILSILILVYLASWSGYKLYYKPKNLNNDKTNIGDGYKHSNNESSSELHRFHVLLHISSLLLLMSMPPYMIGTAQIFIDKEPVATHPSLTKSIQISIVHTSRLIGSFVYVLMVQLRYRITRSWRYYSTFWDLILMVVTTVVFTSYLTIFTILFWSCYEVPGRMQLASCQMLHKVSNHLYIVHYLYMSLVDSLLGILLIFRILYMPSCNSGSVRNESSDGVVSSDDGHVKRVAFMVPDKNDQEQKSLSVNSNNRKAFKKRWSAVGGRVKVFLTFWFAMLFAYVGIFVEFPNVDKASKFTLGYLLNHVAFFLTIIQIASSLKYFQLLTKLTETIAKEAFCRNIRNDGGNKNNQSRGTATSTGEVFITVTCCSSTTTTTTTSVNHQESTGCYYEGTLDCIDYEVPELKKYQGNNSTR